MSTSSICHPSKLQRWLLRLRAREKSSRLCNESIKLQFCPLSLLHFTFERGCVTNWTFLRWNLCNRFLNKRFADWNFTQAHDKIFRISLAFRRRGFLLQKNLFDIFLNMFISSDEQLSFKSCGGSNEANLRACKSPERCVIKLGQTKIQKFRFHQFIIDRTVQFIHKGEDFKVP
jgi:hypothetical protein